MLALALWFAGWARTAAAEPSVLSVHAPSMDWPDARHNVEAELRASGFRVVEQQSSAADPASLLAELAARAAQHPESIGSVTVMRVGSTGMAYVWVPARKRMFRVDAPAMESSVAAGMLSLRVADLMAVRPWAVPEPVHEPAAADPPPMSPPSAGANPWLWFGVGSTLGSALGTPGAQVTLGASFPLAKPLILDFAGAMSAFPSRASLPEGSVSVHHQQLGAHLLVEAISRPAWSIATGLGAGALCLQAQGTAAETAIGLRDTTCVSLASARTRWLVRWGPAMLWATAEPGLTFPAVRLRAGDRIEATLGRPWLAATVGLGWQL